MIEGHLVQPRSFSWQVVPGRADQHLLLRTNLHDFPATLAHEELQLRMRSPPPLLELYQLTKSFWRARRLPQHLAVWNARSLEAYPVLESLASRATFRR